jgi:hypothetical protein
MTTAVLSARKTETADLASINWKAVCFAGIVFSLTLLVFYVLQVNSLTRGFYLVSNYQKQISQLGDENKNLQISFAENSFLDEAMAKVQALNFQKTTSVKYIQILDNSVATIKK